MKIKVKQLDQSYNIIFGKNLFNKIAKDLKKDLRYAIITDNNIKFLAIKLKTELKKQNLKSDIFTFKPGESSKTIYTCMNIIEQMLKKKYSRDTLILALGGGVVGDMAGFIAAIFNRGIDYIQIPTTILAQADSSIGGKTGVDTKQGKNLVGAIKQPKKVYIDVALLKGLNIKQISNGLAETIKHAIIKDKEFFKYLENNINKILNKDQNALLKISKQNCKIKGNIVQKDPYEKSLRKILNYGHTIGHAIEQLSKYKLSHGEAIAIGMMAEARIALNYGFPKKDLERQKNLLIKANLPIKIPKNIKNKDIIRLTCLDKKAKNQRARYCLPKAIGKMHKFNNQYVTYVNQNIIKKALNQTR